MGVDVGSLSPAQNVALGVISGTIEVTALQPMLYCKNAVQQGLPLSLNPMVLYRGLGVSVMNMSILTGLQFPLTGMVASAILGGQARPLTSAEKVGSGFAGGAISGIVCAPMELVMIQQQRFGTSMAGAARRIVSEFGASSLLRGLLTSCGREGLFAAGYMGLGPLFGQALIDSYGVEEGIGNFAGAAGAGCIAATLSHPLDTIKTCMQGDIERKTYTTLQGTYRTLVAEAGHGSLFRGWAIRTGRMICAIWIIGQCKDTLAPLLFASTLDETKKKAARDGVM